METPDTDQENKKTHRFQPSPEEPRGAQVSLVRKIIIGLFIVGFWVFFYWFRDQP